MENISSHKMIGIFNDSYPPIIDGVAMTAQNYAEGLYRRQIPVCVVTPKAPDYQIVEPYPVFRYSSLPLIMRKPYRIGLPDIDLAFQDTLERIPFGLVHAHCPFTSGHLALRIAREQKIPLVATFHSKYRDDFEQAVGSRKVADLMVREIMHFYEKADEVWIPQAAVEETIREYGFRGEVIVMENGSDMKPVKDPSEFKIHARRSLHIPVDEMVLLFVGQHIREKNPFMILDALATLKDRMKFRMFFIGTGYAADELKMYADMLGLTPFVHFCGVIYDRQKLQQYYAAAHLFLFPSIYDNAPLVVREAAAMHTPPVLLKGSTASEIITHNENGFLSENSVQDFADTIISALADQNLLNAVAEKASRTVSVSWDTIVDKVYERYCAIM
jgi:glycosyltransferase involved in cell wall biosynthesis